MRCSIPNFRAVGLLAIVTICYLVLFLSSVRAQVPGRYERPDLGIAFWIPKGYDEVDPTPGITILCLGPQDDKYTSRIYVQVKTARTNKLPDNQAAQIVSQMEKLHPGYQSNSQGRFLLNKTEAVMVMGMYPAPSSLPGLNGVLLNTCTVTAIRQGRVYTFVFTTVEDRFKKELPTFVRMIDTLRWMPVRKTKP